MASTQVGATCFSRSANTCCLIDSSSNTASITKSQSAKSARSVVPLISARSRLASSADDPLLGQQLVDLGVDRGRGRWSTRSWSRSVITTGTLQPAQEQGGQLAGHQAGPDDADLGHRPGQRAVRGAGGLAGPLADQLERVQAGPQLRAHDQVGQSLVLGRVRRGPVGGPGGGHQLQRPVRRRRRRRRPSRRRTPAPRPARRPSARAAVDRVAVDGRSSRLTTWPAQSSERSRKSAPSNIASASPSAYAAGAVEHPVLAQRVLDDQGDRALDADQVGHQVRPAPARDQAQEALGQRDPGGGRGDGAVVGSAGRPPARRPAPSR